MITGPMVPSRRLLMAAAAWSALGFAAGLAGGEAGGLMAPWAAGGIALAAAAAVDARLSRRAPALDVERRVPGVWPVDVTADATLLLRNDDARMLAIEVIDDHPAGWTMEGLPHATAIAPGTATAIAYRLRPDRRGNARFGPAHVRIASPLGLWQRTHLLGAPTPVKVFPDYSHLLNRTLAATDRRTRAAGLIRKRQRGEGTDFRQLRDYRRGDSLRAVDWKATARRQQPITREYQEERDQQVVFLLDTGRRMLARDATGTHFDHALHAVLTLAYVAQRQGDAVGLMSFGVDQRWIAPAKGRTGLDRLLGGIYDLHAGEAAPDFVAAAAELSRRLRKRAFVVLVTNVRDEDDADLRAACALLSERHLVLCASLREQALDLAVAAPVEGFDDALRGAAAQHYLDQRREAIRRLGMREDRLVDVVPQALGTALVNRYMDVKESGRL